jgi:hypothetical protein
MSDRPSIYVAIALTLLGFASCSDDSDRPCTPEHYVAPTLVGDLYEYCFAGVDRTGDTLSMCLYLDTINLPSNNNHIPKLVLSSRPTNPIAGSDRLAFCFSDTLSAVIDPGLLAQSGWKVAISLAVIRYSPDYRGRCWRPSLVELDGHQKDATFLYDPSDTLGIYIHHVSIGDRPQASDPRGGLPYD